MPCAALLSEHWNIYDDASIRREQRRAQNSVVEILGKPNKLISQMIEQEYFWRRMWRMALLLTLRSLNSFHEKFSFEEFSSKRRDYFVR